MADFISPELWEAYERTEYRVDSILLRVGENAVGLNSDGIPWAYLTAWNPRSKPQAESVNRERQRVLENLLRGQGFPCLSGIARDPLGRWPDEEGVLALGLKPDQAVALGREFGQNAILIGTGEGPVQLIRC